MARYLCFASLCLVQLTLAGCSAWQAKWGPDKPHISYASLESKEESPLDKIYVWNPNHNAAYIFSDGRGACIASADVAKTRSYDYDIKASVEKLLAAPEADVSLKTKLSLVESVTQLSQKDAASTFLNTAMFHICMIAAAKNIPPDEVSELLSKALELAGKYGDRERVEDEAQ